MQDKEFLRELEKAITSNGLIGQYSSDIESASPFCGYNDPTLPMIDIAKRTLIEAGLVQIVRDLEAKRFWLKIGAQKDPGPEIKVFFDQRRWDEMSNTFLQWGRRPIVQPRLSNLKKLAAELAGLMPESTVGTKARSDLEEFSKSSEAWEG